MSHSHLHANTVRDGARATARRLVSKTSEGRGGSTPGFVWRYDALRATLSGDCVVELCWFRETRSVDPHS